MAEAYVEGQGRHHPRASCVLGSPDWKLLGRRERPMSAPYGEVMPLHHNPGRFLLA